MIEMGFYRFASQAEWQATCAQAGVDPEAPPARMAIDVVGEIVRDGEVLPGWHVNIAWNEIDELGAFKPFAGTAREAHAGLRPASVGGVTSRDLLLGA